MGLFGRKNDEPERTRGDETETQRRGERTGPSPGLVRALFTLAGVAAAGFLVWLAQTFDWSGSTGEFWLAAALLAAAGLVLGLSQLFGGWTKWGWPTLSPTVFLFGFLPTLIVGGWILLAKQPQDGVEEGRFDRWSSDIGIGGLIDALFELWPAIPLIIGLILAFSFDTTGPRTHVVERERSIPDEDVHDYQREPTRTREPVGVGPAPARSPLATETRTGSEPPLETRPPLPGETRASDSDVGAHTADPGERSRTSDATVAEEIRRREDGSETPPERRPTG